MQHNVVKITLLEKIISVLSYFSMGIIGLLWIIFAYVCKRNLKYFLMYNISQSMIISIILAIIKLCFSTILSLLSFIPFLNFITAVINFVISLKIIRFYPSGISFTLFELFVFILLIYIVTGVILGRIFYIPILSKFMNKFMNSYKK